ncbi:MAG: hypothetical protein CMN78_02915 [Spirochaetales bacterium]|nr:hypothetical protein [Spirochaetales bacterium]
MLSVIDLIEAGTLSVQQAAWLAVRIFDGASFLVGARPGGAGKTTVMGALLGLLPDKTSAHLAKPGTGWRESRTGDCIVAYEVSAGSYEAYIWGGDLRLFCRCGRSGRRIVSNLHADTIEEAEDQIVKENGVERRDFLSFDIFLPIRVRSRLKRIERRVDSIYVVEDERWLMATPDAGPREQKCQGFFESCLLEGVKRIEEVRERWVRLATDL